MNRYQWNRSLIEPFTRMSLWGIRWDTPGAAAMRSSLLPQLWERQAAVDSLTGVALPSSTEGLLEAAALKCCCIVPLRKQRKGYKEMRPVLADDGSPVLKKDGKVKRAAFQVPPRDLSWALLAETAKLGGAETLASLRTLSEVNASPARDAEIASLLGLSLNVESSDQVIETLDRLGLPAKFKRGKRDPDDPDAGRTADEEALLELFIATGHPLTKAILEARSLRTALSWLDSMQVDEDGRVRCSFNGVGSETGRVLTRVWHSGSGGNLQAVSKEPINFQKLLIPDQGMRMGKHDLKTADAWTAAARCALCGDNTMMLDLQAGIRLPSLLSLLMKGVALPSDREQLRKLCKREKDECPPEDKWRDHTYKQGIYLSFYMGSANLIRRGTVRESWFATGAPVDPGLEFCKRVQELVLRRYWGLKSWWADVERQVRHNGTLTGASGQTREFMSRRWSGEGANRRLDHSTHKEAIATEPQMNTTFANNLALWRMWSDPCNWPSGIVGDGRPIVQPMLHIHDAILEQHPVDREAWTAEQVTRWFANPLRLGAITLVIPVESKFGDAWGSCE